MNTLGLSRKAAYVGAGAGLALFVIIGLLPGSFLGGTMGLSIAGALLGSPVSSALLPRVIVGLSMLFGVMVTGVAFVACGTVVGGACVFAGGLVGAGALVGAAHAANMVTIVMANRNLIALFILVLLRK